ncbi:beta-galactosidase 16-like [Andrographis paniculata]|uniref:beta-galactosidase 16-like n=1 Tax=Andrographis paniculata TaxID=175694 RepID=UPI0021E989BA|nr:beta-galactosidase 16-like [Andrographis paniculata]XP_051139236.1 beta-galactosidase 16-like [Andrographis paniculata]
MYSSRNMCLKWLLLLLIAVAGGAVAAASSAVRRDGGVTYDRRSLIIAGRRKLLFSGSIHYPRSTPDMWTSLIAKAKEGGLNTIDTYVFWNVHEPQPGQYDFSGRADIVRFIKEIQAQGLYTILRIGPFIQAEWTYGGLPFWLREVPGIVFRTDNEPYKFYMQNFTTKIVDLMKSEKLFASQGGPIVLSQIENEYQNVEKAFNEAGARYVLWAAKMAVGLNTGVPWVMCKQDDAPDPVINACNGRSCAETFVGPNSPNKPAIWTENWTHLYDLYGNATRIYKPEYIAYQVALFIAKLNGSFINYYMYHGGTNFGRTTSAFTLTSYYDPAPLDEYGLINEPLWGHLRELHAAVQNCSDTLLYGQQTNYSLGPLQRAYVYSGDERKCAAFLVNADRNNTDIKFQNRTYRLPAESISILPDCNIVSFNTAKVAAKCTERIRVPTMKFDSPMLWQEWREVIPVFDSTTLRSNLLLEQMNTTKDTSDYLWYTAEYEVPADAKAEIKIGSRGHVLRAYINGRLVGSAHGYFRNFSFTLDTTVLFHRGVNTISLLSIMVGMPDSGAYLESRAAGLVNVNVLGNQGSKNLTDKYPWGYQVGLVGERVQIYSMNGSSKVPWSKYTISPNQLTWYKAIFDAPGGSDPVAINLNSMRKGQVWINGQGIGRYWISFPKPDGMPSQTWLHIPRSFLKPRGNMLVLFEEEMGNPLGISIGTVYLKKLCNRYNSYPFLGFSSTRRS